MMNTKSYPNNTAQDIELLCQASRIRITDEFTLPPIVLRVQDAVIGTLGNFSVSTGKAKAKKTFNVCAIVASALINGQVLEYRASFPESKRTILYFDTEQSPYHCWLVLQRILTLAGLPLDQEPEHLQFFHLRSVADPNLRRSIIRHTIYQTPDVGLVVIDGIRDLMHDINSSTEATDLVGELMQWTGEQNIHIQTVLHLNKGDDNARGHIGTELNNKAESILLVAKDSADIERSIVSPSIIRSKPFSPFAFRLSEASGVCLPELDEDYTDKCTTTHSYQELSTETHQQALKNAFAQDITLSYANLIDRLDSTYNRVTGRPYRQTKLKELVRFLLNKRMLIKEGRGRYSLSPGLSN